MGVFDQKAPVSRKGKYSMSSCLKKTGKVFVEREGNDTSFLSGCPSFKERKYKKRNSFKERR